MQAPLTQTSSTLGLASRRSWAEMVLDIVASLGRDSLAGEQGGWGRAEVGFLCFALYSFSTHANVTYPVCYTYP